MPETGGEKSHRQAVEPCHAGDADAVSTGRGASDGIAFVEHSEVAEGASLMASRLTAFICYVL